MTKDKWINIRCTEQERQDITQQAKKNNMTIAQFVRYLIMKENKKENEKKQIKYESMDTFRNELMDKFLYLCNYNDFSKLNLEKIADTINEIYDKCIDNI